MQPSLNKPHQTELTNNKSKTHIECVSLKVNSLLILPIVNIFAKKFDTVQYQKYNRN